jgi:hypothetical protein
MHKNRLTKLALLRQVGAVAILGSFSRVYRSPAAGSQAARGKVPHFLSACQSDAAQWVLGCAPQAKL